MSRGRILVAEDDPAIRQGLVDALESEGYAVLAEPDGARALETFRRQPFDLVLLDVMMPAANGFDVCRSLRRAGSAVPVLFLTAKGEEIDKVVGLELGADDYVVKPFGLRELLARVAALLRRSRLADSPPTSAALPDEFRVGKAWINRKTYSARLGKSSSPLTARELALLECFAAHPDQVLSRDDLLNRVWGASYGGTTRTLDQHLAQLRKKIEPDPPSPRALLTVHGVGYRYCSDG